MDPAKIQVIMDWLVPSSVKALREFLGLARYYRKFMQHFGIIAKPSTDLLKKDQVFVWTADHDRPSSCSNMPCAQPRC
jgi:hypothetical protein